MKQIILSFSIIAASISLLTLLLRIPSRSIITIISVFLFTPISYIVLIISFLTSLFTMPSFFIYLATLDYCSRELPQLVLQYLNFIQT